MHNAIKNEDRVKPILVFCTPVTVSGITGIWAYCIRSSCDVYNYHDGSVASDSYGHNSPGIGSSGGGTCLNRSGMVENVGYMNDVAISYGSPVTTISDFTQIIYPNGILNNGSYGVDNSYGTLRSRVIPTVHIV